MGAITAFLGELSRRRVFGVAVLYVVAAWVAIQVADLAIEAGYLRGWSLRSIWHAAFIGFPLALIVGWYYDITREGIVRTPPTDADESFNTSLRRKDFALLASLAVVWVIAVILFHIPPAVNKSIAVLPFENRGHDSENAHFAFGIHDDLMTQLQKLTDIKVIAQPSVERIDKDKSAPQMGLELGVAYIMKGSVERVLDRVRVNVTLIEVEDDSQAGAWTYDRELTAENVFDIRDEIASVITGNLQARLSPDERTRLQGRPTPSLEAWEAYLFGQQRLEIRTNAANEDAISFFQRAIEIDPEFAQAYVGLSSAYHMDNTLRGVTLDTDRMRIPLAKAMGLNDQLGEAYAVRGDINWHEGKNDAAWADFERAIELNPNNSDAYYAYASDLMNSGADNQRVLELLNEGIERDPLSANLRVTKGQVLFRLDLPDEAMAEYQKAIDINPLSPHPYYRMAWEHASVGRLDEAIRSARAGIALDPYGGRYFHLLEYYYLSIGDIPGAEYAAKRYIELVPEARNAMQGMMDYYLAAGNDEQFLNYAGQLIIKDPRDRQWSSGWKPYGIARDNLFEYHLLAGRYDEAREQLIVDWPEFFQATIPTLEGHNWWAAVQVAALFVKLGEQQKADALLAKVLEKLNQNRGGELDEDPGPLEKALVQTLLDQRADAVATLRLVIKNGDRYMLLPRLMRGLLNEFLHDDPEYQKIVAQIRGELAIQLDRVREMEQSGEIPTYPENITLRPRGSDHSL